MIASAEAPEPSPPRSLSDQAIWLQRDLDWAHLVDEARRIGPDPAYAEVGDEQLEQDLCGVASQLAALTARWLELLCELVVRGIWADQGARTPAQWLSWRVGVAPSTAREHVRVALRLRELPRIRAAFAAGELSYSKVRAMTRIAVPEIEEMVLTWAEVSTAAQLEQIAADFRVSRRGSIAWQEELTNGADGPDPDGPDPRYSWSRRTLPDGTMEIRLRCPAEEGAELCAALDRRIDALDDPDVAVERPAGEPETRDSDEPRAVPGQASSDAGGSTSAPARSTSAPARSTSAPARSTADSPPSAAVAQPHAPSPTTDPPGGRAAARVRELLHLLASAGDRRIDTSGLDRHTLVLHARLSELAEDGTGTPVLVDEDQGRVRSLPHATLRRLACDAGLVLAVTDDDGSPIDIGRHDRRLTAALRRALRLRDRTCRFPGCHATRHLHAHHVQHWANGGPTDLPNLVLLCSHHHRFVHEHDWDIEVSPDGVHRFLPSDGGIIDQRAPALPATAVPDEPGDPEVLRPHDVDLSFPRSQRDIIVSVLHQEIVRLAPDLAAAA